MAVSTGNAVSESSESSGSGADHGDFHDCAVVGCLSFVEHEKSSLALSAISASYFVVNEVQLWYNIHFVIHGYLRPTALCFYHF